MSIVCLGELLIDFVSMETGVSVGEASGFIKAPGGAPANVAVGVARLGHQSAFLGQVGEDPFGHFLADFLAAEGVDVEGLRYTDQARTALAFVSLAEDGERSFVFYRHPSADMLMKPEDLAFNKIETSSLFHFGSITLIHEPSRSATLQAAAYARSKGCMVSYDPNLRLALWQNPSAARDGLWLGVPYANVIKISDEELAFMTGGDDVTTLWHDNLKLIVVTHGANGSTAYLPDGTSYHQMTKAVSAVDTTGAGDGFVAGLLVGLLENPDSYAHDLPKILAFANAVGALTTTKRGAIPALPTRDQVMAFLAH
ncbi:MAG: carbohydrate kinase [Phototrophicales bacterium]